MKKARIFGILLLLLALLAGSAQALDVVSYTGDFYVADYADVLSDEVEGHIVLNNDKLYEKCGGQIVFVTVDTVGASGMENYAYTLFNEWGIGSATKHNGILILMAISDDDYWIMPGKGVQDYITAGDLDELIGTYLEPYFAAKDYSGGARALFDQMFDRVSVAYGAGLTVDDSAYFTWLETGGTAQTDDPAQARFLSKPLREQPTVVVPEETAAPQVAMQPSESKLQMEKEGGIGFMEILILLIIIVVLVRVFSRKGRTPRKSSAPVTTRTTPVAPPRPAPRSRVPMGRSGPFAPQNRPGSAPHPRVSQTPTTRSFTTRTGGGGVSRGGGVGRSSFGSSRPVTRTVSRPSRPSGGGFGGGRSGGGGTTRGGGAGRGR